MPLWLVWTLREVILRQVWNSIDFKGQVINWIEKITDFDLKQGKGFGTWEWYQILKSD